MHIGMLDQVGGTNHVSVPNFCSQAYCLPRLSHTIDGIQRRLHQVLRGRSLRPQRKNTRHHGQADGFQDEAGPY